MLQRDRDGVKAMGPGRDWEWKLRERDGSGIDHCGSGTGMGMTAAGTGQDREQRTSPLQNSCWCSESARLLHLGHIAWTCLWRKAWTVCKPQRSSECYQRQMAWCWWSDNEKSYFAVEKLFSSMGKAEWRTYSAHFLLISRLMITVTFWCGLMRTSDDMNDELLANIVLWSVTLFRLYHS